LQKSQIPVENLVKQESITNTRVRARLTIHGAVQGVGFRPCVFRLATELGLAGWISNSAQGVLIELEGDRVQLQKFILRLGAEKPPRSFIQSLETSWLDTVGYRTFRIRASDPKGIKSALLLPDIAACSDCIREMLDPQNRRYLYPFINCTNCGPRFSIIEALPYDRASTSMRLFTMCEQCHAEYEDPGDRRFHAQPNACPVCGPQVELWDQAGKTLASRHAAIVAAADAIESGRIVAIKGLGGFHLAADARNEEAALRLRARKHREEKPFALMFPHLQSAQLACEVSDLEEQLLGASEAPIVLLRRRGWVREKRYAIAPSVAPQNPYLGVMLPYTPLHRLLLDQLGFPIVATSGNLSDEPICIDQYEALERLAGIADLFLVHNRPIVRHVDDSVVRVMAGRELILRRARGYAPLPVQLNVSAPATLAVGAHLKNTVVLSLDRQAFTSQHIGDLETLAAFDAFRNVVADFERLYESRPTAIAADLHPDYLSTKFAQGSGLPVVKVQHHFAHILSCMAENELSPPVLGVAWDGTGYGVDGTIWGGEFLRVTRSGFERVGHFRKFGLPGGEAAIKEPRRAALGLLYQIFGDSTFQMRHLPPLRAFSATELSVLRTMIQRKLNLPFTTSVGRLFDAIVSLIGTRQVASYEGQAASELEWALDGIETDRCYPLSFADNAIDWEPMIRQLIEEKLNGTATRVIAAKVHNTLVESIVTLAQRVQETRVVLSGGCFQNKYLIERAVLRLREQGFAPYWHQRIPPNDGGIALGQSVAVAWRLTKEGSPCV
jgi:hydrogenase maturation protein HypF